MHLFTFLIILTQTLYLMMLLDYCLYPGSFDLVMNLWHVNKWKWKMEMEIWPVKFQYIDIFDKYW
jgi:hypothetical protein